jgi:hypothetical protein
MKKQILSFSLFIMAISSLAGQSKNDMEALFNRIADQGDNFNISISHDLISDLDFDFDFNEARKNLLRKC